MEQNNGPNLMVTVVIYATISLQIVLHLTNTTWSLYFMYIYNKHSRIGYV